MTYAYLDLDELESDPRCRSLFLSKWRPWRFVAGDHGPNCLTVSELQRWLRSLVAQWDVQAGGPIRLLTQLRNWGTYFSPLNLYYLFAPDATTVVAVVAEVNNTPWLEKHWYVLPVRQPGEARRLRIPVHKKQFHVSPFWEMCLQYRWLLTAPGPTVTVGISSSRDRDVQFQAALQLERLALDLPSAKGRLLRQSGTVVKSVAAIYLQALFLWWKRCPVYLHPKHLSSHHDCPIVSGPIRSAQPTREDGDSGSIGSAETWSGAVSSGSTLDS